MIYRVLIFIFCVLLSEVANQTLDDVTSSPNPVVIQNPKPCSTDSKWEELMPALQSLKSNSKMKKERLCNVVKIIKFLLSDEMGNKKSENSKVKEEIKEKVKDPEDDMFPNPTMPDFDSIIEERLKSIKEIIDDRSYMMDEPKENNKTETIKDTPAPKNKTADFSKVLSKIAAALAKLKDQNQSSETQTPNLMTIFRPKNGCKKDYNPTLYENPKQLGNSISGQTGMNPKSSLSMFNIPCQRASDILEETANFPLPRDMFCDNPAVNLNSLAKNTKLNLENLPFNNVVPNSITCVDSDDSIAILFKPKTISLMQVYGNLLKKITITVLVPYYVTKLGF